MSAYAFISQMRGLTTEIPNEPAPIESPVVRIRKGETGMFRKKTTFTLIVTLLGLVFAITPAYADVAPPESAPGSNPVPGGQTQVRMMAETVTLEIAPHPSNPQSAIAKTTAIFTMRNLGANEEKMQARFPLSFFDGNSDGFGRFPEIGAITVKIDGRSVATRREMQAFLENETSYKEREEIPWAVFDITFPPGQDVTIEVGYTVNGFGYYPYQVFRYVLQTGAGWNGTIGSADIIVRLPYAANAQNVWLKDVDGYGEPTQGGLVSGNEVRWRFEDFEPDWGDDFMVVIVTPSLWQTVLREQANVNKNPNDGEAWGRLGKAYKETIMQSKGYLRTDAGGVESLRLAREAYEKCLSLLPDDSLWHYGYAELLWAHYYFDIYFSGQPDADNILPSTLSHLQTALRIDPNNQRARDLLENISYYVSDAVQRDGADFIYLGLTATPVPPTPYGGPASETPESQPTEPPAPAATSTPTATRPLEVDESAPANETPRNPGTVCGAAGLVLPGLAIVLWRRRLAAQNSGTQTSGSLKS